MLNGCRDHDLIPWPTPALFSDVGYMQHFWTRNETEAFGLQGQRHGHAAGLAAASRRFARHEDVTAAKDALFRARDWVGVSALLDDEVRSTASSLPRDPRSELASSVAELRASLRGPVLRAGPVLEQLVSVWALAKQVDADVARPAEALLCAMEGCNLVTAGQVGTRRVIRSRPHSSGE